MKLQKISHINFLSKETFSNNNDVKKPLQYSKTSAFSTSDVSLPTGERNYALFNQAKVDFWTSQKEASIPLVKNMLNDAKDEKEIVEALYITDRLIDNGTKGIDKLYPNLSKFNHSKSANIQTFLAGIYRKIQVPDAFGPLVSMLIKNSMSDKKTNSPFDPNEEIGGAVLSYIQNYSNKK